jgi:hypothetical protein
MKLSSFIFLALLAFLTFLWVRPVEAGTGRPIVSVLAPLAYGPNCWSGVELQNLGPKDAAISVEGHKGSGALVALTGSPGVLLNIPSAGKVTLRLEVPGEESPEGWVKISEWLSETAAQAPTIAVSGETECVENDELTTFSQTVAFPTRDPWLTTDVKDLAGRMVTILNTAKETATARACYSSGITAFVPKEAVPKENGTAGVSIPICSKTLRLQIPPFGTTTIPVVHEGNTEFSLEAKGEAIVLRVVLPRNGGTKTYKVDSSVTFGQPVDGSR